MNLKNLLFRHLRVTAKAPTTTVPTVFNTQETLLSVSTTAIMFLIVAAVSFFLGFCFWALVVIFKRSRRSRQVRLQEFEMVERMVQEEMLEESTEQLNQRLFITSGDQPNQVSTAIVDQSQQLTTTTADQPPYLATTTADQPPHLATTTADQPPHPATTTVEQPPQAAAPASQGNRSTMVACLRKITANQTIPVPTHQKRQSKVPVKYGGG